MTAKKHLKLTSRRLVGDPEYVRDGDRVLHASETIKGCLDISLALGSGDYLDGMCAIDISLTPEQRKQLKEIL